MVCAVATVGAVAEAASVVWAPLEAAERVAAAAHEAHGGRAAESWAGGGAEQSDARDAQVAEALWDLDELLRVQRDAQGHEGRVDLRPELDRDRSELVYVGLCSWLG